jgi:ATP-dependent RNA helicase DeaD
MSDTTTISFKDIVQDDFILRSLDDLGFEHPTEIQAATIPPALAGRDLIGQAKTGSGKTFAFMIPILHTLTSEHSPQALILAPTRELCQQIVQESKKLAKHKRVRIAAIYGGVSINPQIDELEDAQVVVGTPGRILDHLERDTMRVGHIRTLVLDEADRMLDMGFIEDVGRIIQAIPPERQTMLFSATMPTEIKELTHRYQTDPVHIKTQVSVEEHLLPQYYYVVERNQKFSLLAHLIKEEKPKLGIIFCATRQIADVVAHNLQRYNVDASPIHGGLSQAKRDRVIEDFKSGKTKLLIATDVAARGLDIKNVSHVFNYDVPKNPDDYVHRIGRTARAGESGKAITLLENRDFEFFQSVLELPNVNPTELTVPQMRSLGFRRNIDGDSSPRGGRRYEDRDDSRSRGPRRSGERSGGYRPRESRALHGSSHESDSHSSHSASEGHAAGWKQSRRKR